MKNLVPSLLPHLEAHRLAELNAGPDALYPYYNGFSLVNIPGSVCRWLGAPDFGDALSPEILNLHPKNFRHVILLVVDGMGLNTLEEALRLASNDDDYAVWGNLGEEAALAPLTSIVPSTTSAALTSLWTGATPSEHGVVGYEVWLKEYGMIANMIFHNPASYMGDTDSLRKAGFDTETFLPVPHLGPHLARSGVRLYAFQHRSIAYSGLSNMLLRGAEVYGYRSLSDMWVTLDAMLDSRAGDSTYTWIYWGDLDEHSHRFGPGDPRVALELAGFSRQLGYFLEERRKSDRRGDTLLLITADHGHIHTPANAAFELRRHQPLSNCLVMPPSGEARLPYVYLRPGREGEFLQYVQAAWPEQFQAVPSGEAIRAGLFGRRIYERLPDRVGDMIIFPQNGAYWWFGSRDNLLQGRHGGLSRTEMLVPFLSVVL